MKIIQKLLIVCLFIFFTSLSVFAQYKPYEQLLQEQKQRENAQTQFLLQQKRANDLLEEQNRQRQQYQLQQQQQQQLLKQFNRQPDQLNNLSPNYNPGW